MLVGIDHLIIACADPDGAARLIDEQLGLEARGGGRHEAHGTFNRLIWLGDNYIELMGVFDATLAAESWWGAHIAAVLDASPGAYAGMAIASDDLTADIDRLRALGSPISDPIAGQRERPDGEVVRWRIARLPEPDAELGLIFLIEHDAAAAEWRPDDRAERATYSHPIGTPARLARVALPTADIGAASLRLLRGLGLQFRPSLAGQGARDTSIGGQTLRLIGNGPPQVTLRAGHEELNLELLGMRWQLVRA